jgi:hypothetical protein
MAKKSVPPDDVIRDESGPPISEPPVTETEAPAKKDPAILEIDIDDAQIDEPTEDVFRKSPQPMKAPKQRKKA